MQPFGGLFQSAQPGLGVLLHLLGLVTAPDRSAPHLAAHVPRIAEMFHEVRLVLLLLCLSILWVGLTQAATRMA